MEGDNNAWDKGPENKESQNWYTIDNSFIRRADYDK